MSAADHSWGDLYREYERALWRLEYEVEWYLGSAAKDEEPLRAALQRCKATRKAWHDANGAAIEKATGR